ncbi:MAG: class I SAM-dependent methyltransferase [Anaerolineaceae bacterium]|jgi:SAM-dependent methyltransferase|nr:MAG: class I SAM-dependent methyltransferase [Anaerolineaceae bacterium]
MKRDGGYGDYEFIADLYDHVVPYRERQDVSFFVEAAKEVDGWVLEVGCGTGRVLIPTARAGVRITGLDISPHMLAVCKERLGEESAEVQNRVKLVEGDMRNFSVERSFSLVTIPFRPFQHLTTVEDQLDCLGSIQRHLAPGGRLILDLFNPSLEALTRDNLGQELGDEPEFSTPDGRKVKRLNKIVSRDHFKQVIQVELIYDVTYRDGREERLVHEFPMRYLYRFEAEHLLARAGFEIENIYADYNKQPYGSIYPGELIFVARSLS